MRYYIQAYSLPGDDMEKNAWKQYAFWILLSEAVGLISGLLSMEGMNTYAETATQPSFAPPDVLFPIVWTLLYALMGIGMARVQLHGTLPGRTEAGNLFIAQLIVNFFWPLVFFNAKVYGLTLAFLGFLWVLVARMLIVFRKEDRLAGTLQIPYLLWLSFALLLNEQVWQLNR